jgi:hypothetical protein
VIPLFNRTKAPLLSVRRVSSISLLTSALRCMETIARHCWRSDNPHLAWQESSHIESAPQLLGTWIRHMESLILFKAGLLRRVRQGQPGDWTHLLLWTPGIGAGCFPSFGAGPSSYRTIRIPSLCRAFERYQGTGPFAGSGLRHPAAKASHVGTHASSSCRSDEECRRTVRKARTT